MMQDRKSPLIDTYNPYNINFESGKGCYLKDQQGKTYLDFASGIAVNTLGYGHEYFIDALKKQLDTGLIHFSNLFKNTLQEEVADILISKSGLSGAFFCNSGTEAVEGALKMARIYGHINKKGSHVLSMSNSFHGRSYGALSLTGQAKYHKNTWPLLENINHVPYNDIDALSAAIQPETCAIILEPIQGEGGVIPSRQGFLNDVRNLCDNENILLILDEVQTGIARTGEWFAYKHDQIKPDLLCLAKGLGGGFPVGAVLASEKVKASISPGCHASTFGGNPLAMSATKAVLQIIEAEGVIQHVQEMSQLLTEGLKNLKNSQYIEDVRGKGLLIGAQLSKAKAVQSMALEKGLLLVPAGEKVLRFLPPLTVEEAEIKKALDIFQACLEEVYHAG